MCARVLCTITAVSICPSWVQNNASKLRRNQKKDNKRTFWKGSILVLTYAYWDYKTWPQESFGTEAITYVSIIIMFETLPRTVFHDNHLRLWIISPKLKYFFFLSHVEKREITEHVKIILSILSINTRTQNPVVHLDFAELRKYRFWDAKIGVAKSQILYMGH